MVTKSVFLNLQIQIYENQEFIVCLCVCLGVYVPLDIFHSYGDVTITSEGLHILTYTRHSSHLRSEGSLACHTYCDTWHPFIMVITEDP